MKGRTTVKYKLGRPIEVEMPEELESRLDSFRREYEDYELLEERTKHDCLQLQASAEFVYEYVDELVKAALIFKEHVKRQIDWLDVPKSAKRIR